MMTGKSTYPMVVWLLALSAFGVTGQELKQECMKDVREAYRNMDENADKAFKDGRAIHFTYRVKAVPNDTGVSPQQNKIEMYASGTHLHIESGEMAFYQDGKESFTVLPSQKSVFRGDALPDSKLRSRNKHIFSLQDTLFSMGTVASCQQLGNGRKIVMDINREGRDLFRIRRISFYLTRDEAAIRRVRIEYMKNFPASASNVGGLNFVEYEFAMVNYHYASDKLSKPVSKMFLRGKKLNSGYNGWTLVDNRAKANKDAARMHP